MGKPDISQQKKKEIVNQEKFVKLCEEPQCYSCVIIFLGLKASFKPITKA